MENYTITERTNRVWYLLYGLALFMGIVIVRLLYLQVTQYSVLTNLGERNFLRIEIIPPLRGNVYDCKGLLLASNRPVFDLYWQGSGAFTLTKKHLALLKLVGSLLEIDFVESRELLQPIQYAERFGRQYLLKENISFEQLCKISEQCSRAINLMLKNRFDRVYPLRIKWGPIYKAPLLFNSFKLCFSSSS